MTDPYFDSEPAHGLTLQRQGRSLVMRCDGHHLFRLHKPLASPYTFTLYREGNILLLKALGAEPARLCELDSPARAQAALNMVSNMLGGMAQKQEKYLRNGLIIAAAVGLYIAGLVTATVLHTKPDTDRRYLPPERVIRTEPDPPPPVIPASVAESPLPLSSLPPSHPVLPPPEREAPHASAAQPLPRTTLTPEQRQEAQDMLAGNLKNAAQKQLFTVSLSSGHPRTLYVFADPQCHNCRLFEPTLQALSRSINVEIFPVTLVGKDITAKSVIPVLCAPAETRAALWQQLFDDGAGMLDLAHPAPPLPGCKSGELALIRNDKAFALYHLPGTPTVIADDGRPVPFVAMKSEAALSDFLNRKN